MAITSAEAGRITARPAVTEKGGSRDLTTPGLHALALDPVRDALLYVPKGLSADRAAPLVVMLHGAGGEAQHGINSLQELADINPFLLLAPASRGPSWDIIVRRRFGPDIAFLDAALDKIFASFRVDKGHIAVGGFSDGASYALTIGVTNGDLFSHVIAFSPGFVAPERTVGAPAIFVSHGTLDMVLNIDRCSRRIVPQLKATGYAVRYREFIGPHTIPLKIAREAVEWFLSEDRTGKTSPELARFPTDEHSGA